MKRRGSIGLVFVVVKMVFESLLIGGLIIDFAATLTTWFLFMIVLTGYWRMIDVGFILLFNLEVYDT